MIKIYGLRELKRISTSILAADTNLRKTTYADRDAAAEHIARDMRASLDARSKSGRLAESVSVRRLGRAVEVSAGEGLYRPYAYYQEIGVYPRKPVPAVWMHSPYGGYGGWAMKYPATPTSRNTQYYPKDRKAFVMPQNWQGPYMRPAVRAGANYLIRRVGSRVDGLLRRAVK
jgi:hypothetical protein